MTPKQFFSSSAFFAYGADNRPPALDLPVWPLRIGACTWTWPIDRRTLSHAPTSLDSDNRTRERVSIQVSQVSPLVSQGSHHPTPESSILAPTSKPLPANALGDALCRILQCDALLPRTAPLLPIPPQRRLATRRRHWPHHCAWLAAPCASLGHRHRLPRCWHTATGGFSPRRWGQAWGCH